MKPLPKIGTYFVAPLAGAWIEIVGLKPVMFAFEVAPLAGAWIEMPCPVREI